MLYAQDTQKWATYQKEDYKTNAKNEVKSKNQCGTCGQFSASSLLVSLNTSTVTSLEGFFFCDRRQEKDETRLLRRNKLTCDKGPVPDSNKGDILDTRLVSEPRGRLSASLWRLHLAGRPFLQGEMEPVYQGEIKKARQRLRLILINETWVSRCRKDLDVIFV